MRTGLKLHKRHLDQFGLAICFLLQSPSIRAVKTAFSKFRRARRKKTEQSGQAINCDIRASVSLADPLSAPAK